MKCIYCGSSCIKRGKIKEIQRYQCKSCNRFQQNSNNGGINPYSPGSHPFRTFENNLSTFSWAGSGQSEWMRDFNRAFGTLLLVGATGPLAGELAGAFVVGTIKAAAATPAFISNVSYYSRYALVRGYSTYKAVVSSELYFKSLGYASKIMAVPTVSYSLGAGFGFFGEYYKVLSPDFSTPFPAFNIGVQLGSYFYYIQNENYNDEKKDSQQNNER